MHSMILALQRFITHVAIAIWFGGFTCYTAFILRIGSDVIGGLQQGYITTRVTVVLNYLACAMLAAMAVDLWMLRRRKGWYVKLNLYGSWIAILLSQIWLFVLHSQMLQQLDAASLLKPEREFFRPLHSSYQLASTVIWVSCLIYIGFALYSYGRPNSQEQANGTGGDESA